MLIENDGIGEIKGMLSEFSGFEKVIKSSGKYEEWLKYDQVVSGKKIFRVSDEIFRKIKETYYITLPEEIRFFYQGIGSYSDYGLFLQNRIGRQNLCKVTVQYSAQFATALISEYKKLDKWGKIKVSKTIESYDLKGRRFMFSTDLNYLLLGDDNFFDLGQGCFRIPFLQKIYELSGNDVESFRIIFVDNPGEYGIGSGIIVNTARAGFDTQTYDDCGLKIVVNRLEYQYCSNVNENSERHHLVQHKERITAALNNLKEFVTEKIQGPLI